MRIQPAAGYVLYRHLLPETIGSIAIPVASRSQSARAQVLAVGPDVECCKPEDFIVLSPDGRYIEVDPNDSELHLVSAEYVVAVVEYEAADDKPRLITAGGVQ